MKVKIEAESIQKFVDNCNNNISFDELDKKAKSKEAKEREAKYLIIRRLATK